MISKRIKYKTSAKLSTFTWRGPARLIRDRKTLNLEHRIMIDLGLNPLRKGTYPGMRFRDERKASATARLSCILESYDDRTCPSNTAVSSGIVHKVRVWCLFCFPTLGDGLEVVIWPRAMSELGVFSSTVMVGKPGWSWGEGSTCWYIGLSGTRWGFRRSQCGVSWDM